jgi:hypothetical protein
MGFTYKLAPYKSIHPSTTSLTTPLSKIRLRQVVDIGETNLTLSKKKKIKSAHFLMPKHVPNVVANCKTMNLISTAGNTVFASSQVISASSDGEMNLSAFRFGFSCGSQRLWQTGFPLTLFQCPQVLRRLYIYALLSILHLGDSIGLTSMLRAS